MFTPSVFWLWFAGLTFLVIGLFAVRKELSKAPGLDKLIALGCVLMAAPLAVFGAEHLVSAQAIKQVVPVWVPARLFWTYFVGVCLIAAATALVLKKWVRLAAIMLGIMFFGFVVLMHIPNVVKQPEDRVLWAIAFRDTAFGAGAWALAGTQTEEWRARGTSILVTIGRFCIALTAIFYAVEHFLHPEFTPGLPLRKVTPAWFPIGSVWGYLTGAVLLVAGAAILLNKQTRAAAKWLGLVITLVVLFLYVPILTVAAHPPEMVEGINYVFDTLLFAGAILLLAAAVPATGSSASSTASARA